MDILQQFVTVFAVLGLLGGSLWVLRKKGLTQIRFTSQTGKARRLELVERLSLSAQHTVCLVRVDGKLLALGLSPAGCQLITSRDAQ